VVAALNQHPELFHSVIFAGGPFKSNINVYLKLLFGDIAGRNKRVLQTSVGFSFPSALMFLPTLEEYADDDIGFIYDTSGLLRIKKKNQRKQK
jgi:hypothetical protein